MMSSLRKDPGLKYIDGTLTTLGDSLLVNPVRVSEFHSLMGVQSMVAGCVALSALK
jgi:hypothetical protein